MTFTVGTITEPTTCQFVVCGWGGATLECTDSPKFEAQSPVNATYRITNDTNTTISCYTPAGGGLGKAESGAALCTKHARAVAESITGSKVLVKDLKSLVN